MTAIKSFAQLERTGWEQVAHRYDEVWASLTKQFIPPLLKAAAMKSGMSVLDVACGPGYVAAEVKRLGATATGIDFSFEMVRQAQAMNPGIKFFEGDAQRLPFPAESFERVLMNFGLLHLPSPEEALAEACRVLRNKGRLAFTLWAKPEENPGAKIMEDAIEAHGDKAVKLPPGPPYFVYANSEECKKILRRVGFEESSVTFDTRTVFWRVPTAGFLFEAELNAGVRTAALLHRHSPERLAAIRATSEKNIQQYKNQNGYSIPMAAYVVAASR